MVVSATSSAVSATSSAFRSTPIPPLTRSISAALFPGANGSELRPPIDKWAHRGLILQENINQPTHISTELLVRAQLRFALLDHGAVQLLDLVVQGAQVRHVVIWRSRCARRGLTAPAHDRRHLSEAGVGGHECRVWGEKVRRRGRSSQLAGPT